MKMRHKAPAVFSIYMVDVLCCALGCVILLWQLYHHESEEQTAKNDEIRKQLEDANQAKDATLKKLASANLAISALHSDVDALKVTLDAAKKRQVQVTLELDDTRKERDKTLALALVHKQDYDDAKKALAAAEAVLALTRDDLTAQEKKSTLTAAELADKIRAHAELLDKLADAERKVRALTRDLALKETDTQVALKRSEEKGNLLKLLEQELNLLRSRNKDVQDKLATADIRGRLLEQDLDRGKKELTDVNRRFAELLLAQDTLSKRMTISVKDLERAKQALALLELDRNALSRKAAAAENRFAGITLTGQRVIFLVDMSGSMEMIDGTTFDPDKWPIVCETVARVMRSLTDLREYQVILFSERSRYALGNDGRWLTYEGEPSANKVASALKALKPKGGTDMYAAFQEAFGFRESGLDTIYLFSDGLPNLGDGLPAGSSNLSESQKSEVLGKHVRARLKNVWNRPIPNQPRVRINSVGFFFESPDLGAFLWALAREHDGSFVGMSRP